MSGQTLSPADMGIGMRISVHPHTDNFADIILDAIETTNNELDLSSLEVSTGEVSTYVGVTSGAAAQQLADYATTLIAAASRASNRQHLTSHLLFSRGCPGEATCELIGGEIPVEHTVEIAKTGIDAVAAWSLYPLSDDGSSHMDPIYAAIDEAKASGVTVTSEHYATILRGDLADVLAVAVNAWAQVGAEVPHVVSHVSVSLDSPTPRRAGDTA